MAEIYLHHPSEFVVSEWRELQTIARDAYAETLDRSQQEIDALVEWDDPQRFIASHVDPNNEVGKRYNLNQLYTQPRIVTAVENGELVGFGYSASNVSGASEAQRRFKHLSVIKNYLWLREIAIKPEYMRQGIGTQIGRTLLKKAVALQPVTAYTWPDEDPTFIEDGLRRLGFKQTGESQSRIFGPDSQSVREVRMQASSARVVLKNIDG